VLYKHINSWIPAPCLRLAGAGYNMQGLGQAGQADYTDLTNKKKGPKKHFFWLVIAAPIGCAHRLNTSQVLPRILQ